MDEKINLSSLAGLVADATGFSRRVVETFLKELFTYVSSCLVEGDSVRIPGIGLFKARKVSSRKSVSVTTGKEIEIPAYVKVTFDPDKELAEAVNAPFEIFEAVELADDVTEDMLEEEIVSDNIADAQEAEETVIETAEEAFTEESAGLAHAIEESEDEVREETEENALVPDNEPEEADETAVSEEAGYTEAVSDTIEEPRAVEEEAPAYKPEAQPQPDPQPVRRKYHWGWFVSGFACAIFLAFIAGVIYWGVDVDNEVEKPASAAAVKPEKPAKDTVVTVAKADTARLEMEPVDAVSESPVSVADTQPSDIKPDKKYDTVTRTRYLTTMSREYYGNYHFWPYIYEENKAILGHPDRIRPGTKVVIPSLSKYGVDPKNPKDVAEAKRKGVAIYARYRQ